MTRRLRIATLVLILLAPLSAYLSSVRYQFVFDDPDQIVNNAAVHSWKTLEYSMRTLDETRVSKDLTLAPQKSNLRDICGRLLLEGSIVSIL